MYYAALRQSMELAREHGPYASYEGSPMSKGVLQFDMWGVKQLPSDRCAAAGCRVGGGGQRLGQPARRGRQFLDGDLAQSTHVQ